MNKYLQLVTFANTSYSKCECCERVRDIYFRLNVMRYEMPNMLSGSFELCKLCGQNIGSILKQKTDVESVVTDFKFE